MSDTEAVILFFVLLALVIILSLALSSAIGFIQSKFTRRFSPKEGERIEGIGGWLLIPPIGLVVTAYMSFADIYYVCVIEGISSFVAIYTTAVGAIVGLSALYLLIPFFQKKRLTALLMIGFYLFTLLIFILGLMIVLLTQPITNESGFRFFEEFATKCISSFIWIIYFMSSERVQNTFIEKAVEQGSSNLVRSADTL